jgi:putative ABC transport system permease protein
MRTALAVASRKSDAISRQFVTSCERPSVWQRFGSVCRFHFSKDLLMSSLFADLRYSIRILTRSPAFSIAALLALALGTGANTAIFSVVHAVLLEPLPYPAPDRLVMLWQDMRARGGPAREWATPGNYFDWKAETPVFEHVAAIGGWAPALTGAGEPEQLVGAQVTATYFDVLGVPPLLGRAFLPEEDVPGAERVVVIAHDLWQRRLAGDPGVVGRTVTLDGEPHAVVGIMPPGFRPAVLAAAQIWRPRRMNAANPSRGAVILRVVARLRADVSVDQARTRLASAAQRLERQYPDWNTKVGFVVERLHDQVVGDVRPALLVLLGAVGFVLLIACANVANLLLARASSRTREIAVRLALGARRGRVIRQLLTESLVLAVAGGAAGLLVAFWGVDLLMAFVPAGGPLNREVGLDVPVLIFTAVVTLLTGLAFGVAPALQTSRPDMAASLKEGGKHGASAGTRRLRRALVAAEVAVAITLLVGAGLLARSFVNLQGTYLGFDPAGVLVASVSPPSARYPEDPQRVAFYDRLIERAAALPGVRTAALTSIIPLAIGDSDMSFLIEGVPPPATGEDYPVGWYRIVSPGYFDTLRLPLARGRTFEESEPAPVFVVNEAMVRKYWPAEDPLGRRIRLSRNGPWFTLVGVVGDVRQRGARETPQPQMYFPYRQFIEPGAVVVALRTDGDPLALASSLRSAVREIDADLPVYGVARLDELVSGSVAQPRFVMLLVVVFAALALSLAAVGIYGVMSYTVVQRTGELGVRMALGASPGDLFRLLLGDALRVTAAGLAIGCGAALLLGRTMRGLLFGVSSADPLTFAATTAFLLGVALLASYLPARRATRVDPLLALRTE